MCVMTPISPFSDRPHPRRHSVTQLGLSLNLGHVCGDSYWSVQWQTSPTETQCYSVRSVTEPWSCVWWLPSVRTVTDLTNGNTISVRCVTEPRSYTWWLPSVHTVTDLTNGNTMSVNGCVTEPRPCMWCLPSVHMVTDLTNGNTVLHS